MPRREEAGSELFRLFDNIAHLLEEGREGLQDIEDGRRQLAQEIRKTISGIIEHDIPAAKRILQMSSINTLREVDKEITQLNLNSVMEETVRLLSASRQGGPS